MVPVAFWPPCDRGSGGRGSHPGPFTFRSPVALDDESLADGEDLRRACERLGGSRRTAGSVTYCATGNRASQVAFALTQDLGYPDVAVFHGSWSGWGSPADTPVET
jgi:3-mercaptopyruvate sulfurtransferase SseA